jgi:flagellar assembly protein FliH
MSKIIKSSEAARGAFAAYERDVLGVALAETAVDDVEGEWLDMESMQQAEAQAEVEKRLQELYDEALRRGLEEGKAEYERAAQEAVAALRTAAEAMRKAREEYLAALEPQVLGLVKAIAGRILNREARVDPEVTANTVRTALKALADRERLTVYLNPGDLLALQERGLDPLAGIEGLEGVELAVDETVSPGGCTVASDCVHVDARLDHQLDKIMNALAE